MSELPWRRLTLPTLHRHRKEADQHLSNAYTAGFGIGMEGYFFFFVWLRLSV